MSKAVENEQMMEMPRNSHRAFGQRPSLKIIVS